MADVFISYCRSAGTAELVRRIAGELESRGISCWYDTKTAAPVDFVKRIVTEIDRCKVFLFLWDAKSNANFEESRSYVRREVHRATKKNAALCPFQIGDFEKSPTLEFYFDYINIPYGGDTPETARTGELVEAIAEMLGKPPAPTAQPKPQAAAPPPTKIIKRGECGYEGGNVTFTLDENGVLTISGNGRMRNMMTIDDTPWWDEHKKIV